MPNHWTSRRNPRGMWSCFKEWNHFKWYFRNINWKIIYTTVTHRNQVNTCVNSNGAQQGNLVLRNRHPSGNTCRWLGWHVIRIKQSYEMNLPALVRDPDTVTLKGNKKRDLINGSLPPTVIFQSVNLAWSRRNRIEWSWPISHSSKANQTEYVIYWSSFQLKFGTL